MPWPQPSEPRRARTPIADTARRAAKPPAPQGPPTFWCPEVFAIVEWRRFELVVETLFAQAGFETRSKSHGADGGVDIWLYSKNHGDGAIPVSVVQCKQWSSRKVGVKDVRELRGVMAQHHVGRGQFVTTSGYSDDARLFAQDNGIALHDTHGLLRLIAARHPKQQEALLAAALEGDYARPTCVACGIKLVERTARGTGRRFWGCENYPRCRRTMEMR